MEITGDRQQVELDKEFYHLAKQKALEYLARRDYSRADLLNKLETKLKPNTVQKMLIVQVLDELNQLELQSDERFTEAFVRHRFNKGFGSKRILMELRSHGIESQLAESYLVSSELDYLDSLYKVWSKKYQHKPRDYSEKAKQERFLTYRGFSSDQIKNFWESLESEGI